VREQERQVRDPAHASGLRFNDNHHALGNIDDSLPM